LDGFLFGRNNNTFFGYTTVPLDRLEDALNLIELFGSPPVQSALPDLESNGFCGNHH
jgi:hypothetical protein